MGYAGDPKTGSADSPKTTAAVLALLTVALYNVLELNAIIALTFKRRSGLYFWSFVFASNGIAPHAVGFLLKDILNSDNWRLYVTLIVVGWVPMITGQSLVLYSRLHILFWNQFYMRLILAMIIFNAIVLHIPVIVIKYGANSSPMNPWVHPFMIYEKVQVTTFFLQELLISSVYIGACFSFFDTKDSLYGDAVYKMRRHLLLINIFIILLDIPILCLEYTDNYDLQTAYKGFAYSVKLKMEFRILNDLVEMTRGGREISRFLDRSSMPTGRRI